MNTPKEALVTREYHYAVLFEPAKEGGYTVTCPALPGLVTEGDTREEARAMVADAIRCYLKSLEKDGIPPPVEEELEALPDPREGYGSAHRGMRRRLPALTTESYLADGV